MATKVLVAVHPAMSHTPAFERVKAIAQHARLDIRLYSSVHSQVSSVSSFITKKTHASFAASIAAAQTKRLQALADELSDIANSIEIEVDGQLPTAAGILAAASKDATNLIIMSSTRHSLVARWFTSNTDWEVLRAAKVPVLLAHHQVFSPYTTVLAAVDPTHQHDEPARLDHDIIHNAEMAAKWFDGEVHIGHAFPSQKSQIEIEYLPPKATIEQWQREHAAAIHKLAETHGIPIARQHLSGEFTVKAIPEIALNISADLVVLGVVSRSHLKQLWLGQTLEQMLDRLQCDVLTTSPVK